VTLDPKSHHLNQNIYIAEGNSKHGFNILETFEDVPAVFEGEKCDLVKDPTLVEHFTPGS
jgi:branched-chain amino acid transport system substrate-binding protein